MREYVWLSADRSLSLNISRRIYTHTNTHTHQIHDTQRHTHARICACPFIPPLGSLACSPVIHICMSLSIYTHLHRPFSNPLCLLPLSASIPLTLPVASLALARSFCFPTPSLLTPLSKSSLTQGVDFVAASFIRKASDVIGIRKVSRVIVLHVCGVLMSCAVNHFWFTPQDYLGVINFPCFPEYLRRLLFGAGTLVLVP